VTWTGDRLGELRAFLADHLLNSVMPFWLRHAPDPGGGLNTCIRDDGSLVSRDKWLWSQWRAVWVFSRLYEQFGRDPRWLEAARSVCAFSLRHGWDDRAGGWVLRVSGDGRVLDGCDSLYTDAFAIYGLTALGRVTGDPQAREWARRTAYRALERLR